MAGTENVTLVASQMPMHTHAVNVINNKQGVGRAGPTNAVYGQAGGAQMVYGPPNSPVTLDPSVLAMAGGSQSHPNMQPYEVITFNIAMTGIFPSRG